MTIINRELAFRISGELLNINKVNVSKYLNKQFVEVVDIVPHPAPNSEKIFKNTSQ